MEKMVHNTPFSGLIEDFRVSKDRLVRGVRFNTPIIDYEPDEVYSSIGILGGGTAGYFAALALKKFTNIPITVIESSKIPVIGVGEATTPAIQHFLFNVLRFDKREFYERVEPTWKLGIKFEWGLPGNYFFNYPFGETDILSAYLLNRNINYCSLTSLLMSKDSSFVLKHPDGEVYSLSSDLLYAYHLDNKKLIHYLKEKAVERGISFLDIEIKDATLLPNANGIDELITHQGEKLHFDFYVDCSGFASFLLEQKLGSPYISYKDSLITDRAIVATVPNEASVKPYTLAETMDHGWCWKIPLRHEDHRGYVFSSDFCSDEEAYAEMLSKNPSMERDAKIVKFRSGRHPHFIKGNVAAVGNSYAFVEPLESTGLHMIIHEVSVLVNNILRLRKAPQLTDLINKDMNAHWDYLRWFLAIHYKFNKKLNTKFWVTNREEADISGIEPLVNLYQEVGLLSRQEHYLSSFIKKETHDFLFDLHGIDHILFGQAVLPGKIYQMTLPQPEKWKANIETWEKILPFTVPLREDLEILLANPHLM